MAMGPGPLGLWSVSTAILSFVLCNIPHDPVEKHRWQNTSLFGSSVHCEGLCKLAVVDHSAFEVLIEGLDDVNPFLWNAEVNGSGAGFSKETRSRCMLSNAFSKSSKSIQHIQCSTPETALVFAVRSTNMWSVHDLPSLTPICSWRNICSLQPLWYTVKWCDWGPYW